MDKVMKKNTHYGTVPGCGSKMVLLKPGADVLAMTFRLVPQFSVTRMELENGHREYDVTCSMYGPNGELLGQGVGSASTMEKKYRYRKDECGGKVENEDIADVYNTVLKIAKKRAHIDATLTVTGAADIFTQDLIDEDDQSANPPVTMPTERKAKPAATEGQYTVRGIIDSVVMSHSKPDAKKAWTRTGATVDGVTYGTFDKAIGDSAVALEGSAAILTVQDDGKYKNLLAIEPGDAPEQSDDELPFG